MIDEDACGLCTGGTCSCDDCDGAGWDPSASTDYPWCQSCEGMGRVPCCFCADAEGWPGDDAGDHEP